MEDNLFWERKFNEKTRIEDVSRLRSAIPPWGHFYVNKDKYKPTNEVFLRLVCGIGGKTQKLNLSACNFCSKIVLYKKLLIMPLKYNAPKIRN